MKVIILFALFLSISCSHQEKIKVIAHRGASGYLPEHTLPSVSMAHSFNVDYIEPDVVLTKDNIPVILHDIHLDTTTNVRTLYPKRVRKDGRFYAIDFTLKEIKKLTVNERIQANGKSVFPQRFPQGLSHLKVPTLSEFIELVQGLNTSRNKKIGIYPEIKSPSFHRSHKKDISKIVIKMLKRYGYNKNSDNFFLQCFDQKELISIHELYPQIPLIQLIGENSWKESDTDYNFLQTDEGLKKISKYAVGVGPWLSHILKANKSSYKVTSLVRIAHKYGLKVHPYTHRLEQIPAFFNSSDDLLNVLFNDVKIDGIFSDFSDEVVRYLKR